jgi:hypothetical protein
MRESLSESLIDILLEEKDGSKVPSSVAKTILLYWHRDKLASEAGLTSLLRAVVEAAPIKTASVLDEFGLEKIKLAISPAEA